MDMKNKNQYTKDYKNYYSDVVDYSIEVYKKFATHNMAMFFLYGLGLAVIETERKMLVCGLCFGMSFISIVTLLLMKYYFPIIKKRVIIYENIHMLLFLVLLTLLYYFHPSHIAYTILLCTIITTAMTNMMPPQYRIIILSVSVFDLIIYMTQQPLGNAVEIVGYVVNDCLIIAFAIGINFLYSNMKFREFKEKNFLQNESYHDPLTKIYNRRYVERYVEMNLDIAEICTMILIDLDNFKTVNDELGHEAGDMVLCKVSEILRNNFRKSDCVARLGGDEFMVIMPSVSDKSDVIEKVKKILREFPIIMEDESGTRAIPVSLSIGITFTNVGEANEYEELYRRADSFMYKAKKRGKGCAVMEGKNGREIIINESIGK